MARERFRRAGVVLGGVTVAFFALATPACGGGDEGGVAPGAGGASGGGGGDAGGGGGDAGALEGGAGAADADASGDGAGGADAGGDGAGGASDGAAGQGGAGGATDAGDDGGDDGGAHWVIYEMSAEATLMAVTVHGDGTFGAPQVLATGRSQYLYGAVGPCWSRDGAVLAVDGETTLDIFDMRNEPPLLLDSVNTSYASGKAWSHDGSKLIYGDSGGAVSLYDRATKTSTLLATGWVPRVAWSLDDAWAALTSGGECYVADAATGATTAVPVPAGHSTIGSCEWAPDGSFLWMTLPPDDAAIFPFSGGTIGTPVYVGARAALSPRDNLALLQEANGDFRLAKVTASGVGATTLLHHAPANDASFYESNWNSTGTRALLTHLSASPVLVDATSWPPGVTVGAPANGATAINYGWSTPRWFSYVQDAKMMVIDGAVTSSVTRYELADDMSAHGMLGGFEPSADGTAIVLDPYYEPGSDPVKPQHFVDLAGATPAAAVDLPTSEAHVLSRGGVRYVVYRDQTDSGLYARKILPDGTLASAALLTGTLAVVDQIGVQP